MAFEGAMKAMGSKPPMKGKPAPKPKEGKVEGEKPDAQPQGEESTTTITHNADGTHTMDGETHPDHLHLMAHLGHKLTGDKHHVAHHDGMNIHTHGVHESGEHEETQSHNTAEEAKEAMGNFFNEEAQEPEHQHEPAMGAYGG